MPWRSNGDYYAFKEEAILAHAPPFSGVYGLYNIKHQILIGHAPSIRDALLHHLRKTHFHFRRFQPTGFTFEVCAPEAREPRAQELIGECNPILQRRRTLPLGALWWSWTAPATWVLSPHQVAKSKKLDSDRPSQPSVNVKQNGPFADRLFGRKRLAIAAAVCGVAIFALGLLELLPRLETAANRLRSEVSLLKQYWSFSGDEPAQLASLTLPPEAPEAARRSEHGMGWQEPNAELSKARLSELAIDPPNGKDSVAVETPPRNAAPRIDNNEKGLTANHRAASKPDPLRKAEARNPWAVQALATTEQRIASAWLDKLQAKGYDTYVIEAEIKGQTWYRVRAGNFTTRQQAEALQKVLQSREGIRDAFVANNSKSEILIASSLP